jgi:nucleotide-binding universal stress UspA family protein
MAGRIVVGVDGSEHGRAALLWAAEEARLRGARLVAVHAWTYTPPAPIGEPGLVPMPGSDLADELRLEQEAAERALADTIEVALGDGRGVELERLLVEDAAGDALVHAAHDADLVVVGSRGRGGLKAALLGSVSSHVVHHAPCPVVVVRAHAAAH